MADEIVKNLLIKWNMGDLISIFEEQEIDEFCLVDLSIDSVKELIPKIGPRTKFMRHLQIYRSRIGADNNNSLGTSEVGHSASTKNTLSVPSASTSSTVDSADEDLCNVNINQVEAKTAYKRATSDGKNFYGVEEMKKSCRSAYHLSLSKFLNLTGAGKHILNNYEVEKHLTRKTRNILVELIINAMLSENEVLKDIDFEIIADKICKYFDGEVRSTYYIPRTIDKAGPNKKYINAKGKLVDKYRNLKHLFNSTKTSTIDEEAIDENEIHTQDDLKVSAEWLQKWCQPEELVIEHWLKTFPLRKNFKGTTVKEFLNEWPVLLKNKFTLKLVNLDFKQMFATCNVNLINSFAKWDEFITKLQRIKYGNESCDNIELINFLKNDTLQEDCKNAIQFALLATLCPPKEIIRTNKKRYKPSIIECQESMIVLVEIPGDIENKIEQKKSRLLTFGLTDQPYLIVVGPNWSNITDFYAVIDENIIKCDSVLSAIDLLFKTFHVLNAHYPEESTHIWLLIQQWIYGVSTKTDKVIPYVSTFIQELSH